MIYTVIILIYLIGSVVICKLNNTKERSSKAFFVAKNELTNHLLIPMLFAGMIGGTTITSAAATGYSAGLMGIVHVVGMCIGSGIFIVFVSKPYQILVEKRGTMSVPAAFEIFFGEKVKNLMVIVIALTNCMILATVPSSVSALLAPITGINQKLLFWIVWLVWFLMTVTGGIKGIAAMNILHSAVMVVSIIGVLIGSLKMLGGFAPLAASVPAQSWNPFSGGFMSVLAMILGAAIAQPTNTVISSAVFSGKNYKTSIKSIIIASLLMIPFALCIALCGMCASIIVPGVPENTALAALAKTVGPVFSVMVSMAICAATISTAPASLLAVSNIFSNNIYKAYFRREASDRELKLSAIIFAFVASVGLSILSGNAPSLLSQLTGAAQINSVSGIVMIIGLYWKKVDSNGVFYSMLTGTIVGTVWHSMGNPFGIAVLWPAFASTLLVLVIMTLLNRKEESDCHKQWIAIKEEQ